MKYYLIIRYPGQTQQVLMNTGTKAIAAEPENSELLVEIGKKLLEENVISSYQLLVTAGYEQTA